MPVKKKAGKKRVWGTPKQKAALKKGRTALALRRKKRKVTTVKKRIKKKTTPKQSIVIFQKGEPVRSKTTRKSPAKKAVTKRRKRRSSYMGGNFGRGKVGLVKRLLVETTIATAAAIFGSVALNKLPITNPRLKALSPLGAGLIVAILAKGKHAKILNNVSSGLMIVGGISLVKQFLPQFALAGEYDAALLGSDMGIPTDIMGLPTDYMEDSSAFDLNEDDQF